MDRYTNATDFEASRVDALATTLLAYVLSAHALLTPGDESLLKRYQVSELHMGTQVTIVLYATNDESANQGFRAAFSRVGNLDAILSDYRSDSELSRLSQSAPKSAAGPARAVPLSSDLWRVLNHSQQLSRRTHGAFDVTVGPLTRLWRRARRQRAMPSENKLQQAMAAIGYQWLELDNDNRTATLLRSEMRLDLGGVAKGYVTDAALKELATLGIDHALVNAGGDMSMGRAPPGTRGWKVGVAPLDATQEPSKLLLLEDGAIATSGDAWQFVEIGGRRYSHIVDPRTGLGLTSRSSVTVVAEDGMTADALASAVSVLGPEKGLALIHQTPGTSALVIRVVNNATQVRQSTRFPKLRAMERSRPEQSSQ